MADAIIKQAAIERSLDNLTKAEELANKPLVDAAKRKELANPRSAFAHIWSLFRERINLYGSVGRRVKLCF